METIINLFITFFQSIIEIVENPKDKKLLRKILVFLIFCILVFYVVKKIIINDDFYESIPNDNDIITEQLTEEISREVSTIDKNDVEETTTEPNADDLQEIAESEKNDNNSESEIVSLNDMKWIEESHIYIHDIATTMRGDTWENCIGFGSSNLNSDDISYILTPCETNYKKFTAEIAPEDGFDSSEAVILTIYGESPKGEYISLGEYKIDHMTKAFKVEYDISNVENLYFYKDGNYNMARIAGQYLNGYTGMGVIMRDAKLYR